MGIIGHGEAHGLREIHGVLRRWLHLVELHMEMMDDDRCAAATNAVRAEKAQPDGLPAAHETVKPAVASVKARPWPKAGKGAGRVGRGFRYGAWSTA